MGAIRILGIDPGLGITGYGVVEKQGARSPTSRAGASSRTDKDALVAAPVDHPRGLDQVIESFRPAKWRSRRFS
jgi:crossover junction endodeoxyribonuclease RuvC